MGFFSALDKLLTLILGWVALRNQEKAQAERDNLEKNPANWFSNHFSGMPTDADKTTKTDKADINH
ncbi:hypothetical protein UFOVP263_33 [uncultured Caudovirales phage]|uniref:Uncharacterized protein n=1 Tax=uncultured Caudovirales phage TaxID=2100421 RepID=A0A6J5LL85_9CAUD|nr:hypothetical protein UFOVP263_33 [uncultured Caudovirales phage]CAB4242048.1 hypothetical protein UFOVP91_29 [uncultured Caudovirales phage]